jgi:hypothetical protein
MRVVNGDDIVVAARAYLGTRFRHQGRRRSLDCVGLVLSVAEDLGLLDRFGSLIRREDYGHYGPQPVDGAVLRECEKRLVRLTYSANSVATTLEPGQVLVLRAPFVPCHAGIATQLEFGPGVVHAYPPSGGVVENLLDAAWLRRIAGVFWFPEVGTHG